MRILILVFNLLCLNCFLLSQDILDTSHIHTYEDYLVINDKTINFEKTADCYIGNLNFNKDGAFQKQAFIPFFIDGKIKVSDDRWIAMAIGKDGDDVGYDKYFLFYEDENENIVTRELELSSIDYSKEWDFTIFQDSMIVVINSSNESITTYDLDFNIILEDKLLYDYHSIFSINDNLYLIDESGLFMTNSSYEIINSLAPFNKILGYTIHHNEITLATQNFLFVYNSDLSTQLNEVFLPLNAQSIDLAYNEDMLYLLMTELESSLLGIYEENIGITILDVENFSQFNYTQFIKGDKRVLGHQIIKKPNYISLQNTVIAPFANFNHSGPDVEIWVDEIFEIKDTIEVITYPNNPDTFYNINYLYDFTFIITNNSNEVVNDVYVASDRFPIVNCAYSGYSEKLSGLDLLPNESLPFKASIKSRYQRAQNLCMYILTVNGLIDKKFSNNSTCTPIISSNSKIDVHNEIRIFPNPTSGEFTIDSDQELSDFKLINSQGQTILHGKTTQQFTLNLDQFPDGIYIIQLKDKLGRSTSKRISKF